MVQEREKEVDTLLWGSVCSAVRCCNKLLWSGNSWDWADYLLLPKKWCASVQVTLASYHCLRYSFPQLLFEDGETNRIVEALELFDEICNSRSRSNNFTLICIVIAYRPCVIFLRWFARASMILFLNKRDLFADKIKKKAITGTSFFLCLWKCTLSSGHDVVCVNMWTVSPALAGYEGDNSYADTTEYIIEVDFTPLQLCLFYSLLCHLVSSHMHVVYLGVRWS